MKIPTRILEEFGRAAHGLEYGHAAMELHAKGGSIRVVIRGERSFHLTPDEREGLFREGGGGDRAPENARPCAEVRGRAGGGVGGGD